MNKDELLPAKINMPIEHIEEVAIAENKIADLYETIRRNRNQINIKNQVSKYQLPNKIEKKDDNYKEIYYKYGNYSSKMQILAYVANIDSISVVDILSGKEAVRIPLDVIPLDVVISPDKKYVYTTYPDDVALGVISIECNEEIARINLNKPPFTSQVSLAVAVSPNGRFIYVSNFDSQNISIVEYKNHMWKVIGEVPISVAISKNYVGILANARSDDIMIFNSKLALSSPVNIPVGDRPLGVAFNSKGNLAYVTNRGGNSVSVVNVFLNTIKRVVNTVAIGLEPFFLDKVTVDRCIK